MVFVLFELLLKSARYVGIYISNRWNGILICAFNKNIDCRIEHSTLQKHLIAVLRSRDEPLCIRKYEYKYKCNRIPRFQYE